MGELTFDALLCAQLMGSLAKILERHLPNPPLIKGRGQDFKFSPFIRGD